MEEKESKETIAEILAEYRADADKMDRGELYQPTTIYIRQLLNRIEAAWEREAKAIATENAVLPAVCITKAIGNAAAIREALEKIAHYAEDMCRMDDPYSADWRICADIARKALSLPPRNCDRFADELDTQLAFLNEVWLISIDRETMTEQDEYDNWTDEMRKRYGIWLLAPAAERKGESDGK